LLDRILLNRQRPRARSGNIPRKPHRYPKRKKRNEDGSERRLGPGEDVSSRRYEEAEKESEYGFWNDQVNGNKDGKY
jgi:hypothetical protein